eukprot:3838865-Rhodomonas_salina.2
MVRLGTDTARGTAQYIFADSTVDAAHLPVRPPIALRTSYVMSGTGVAYVRGASYALPTRFLRDARY